LNAISEIERHRYSVEWSCQTTRTRNGDKSEIKDPANHCDILFGLRSD